METDNNTPQAPDFSQEEMKLPANLQSIPATEDRHSPLSGGIIVVLLFILLFILGGLYVWFTEIITFPTTATEPVPMVERPTAAENNEPESTTAEAAVATQQALSTSDELTAIEADILATDLDSLDAELTAIEAEFTAASTSAN